MHIVASPPSSVTAADVDIPNQTGILLYHNVFTLLPAIDATKIDVSFGSAVGTVSVTGSANALTGSGPLTYDVPNTFTNAAVSGLSPAADGSFTATLPAKGGEMIAVTLHDGLGRVVGPVNVGALQVGTVTSQQIAGVDATFRA